MEAAACCVRVSPALMLEHALALGGILGPLLPFSGCWVLFSKPKQVVNTRSLRGFAEQSLGEGGDSFPSPLALGYGLAFV